VSPKLDQELRKQWQQRDEHGEPRKPVRRDEEQFLAEVAAGTFISGVDMPFRVFDVPEPRGSAKKIRRNLWRFYTRKITKKPLFSAKTGAAGSKLYGFHLRYLEILQMEKAWYNKLLVPAWNIHAHRAWLEHKKALTQAFNDLKKAKTPEEKEAAEKKFDQVREPFSKRLIAAFDPVMHGKGELIAARVELSIDLSKHPKALAKGVRISPSQRLDLGDWLLREAQDYLMDLSLRRRVKPPFAEEEDLLFVAR